jgi:hypothetical protein
MAYAGGAAMKQFTIVHEFACTPERFWGLFFDPEFNAALYRDGLRVEGYAVLASRETEAEIQRTVTGRPQLKIPAAAQKIVGDRLSFTEEGRFDKRAGVWRASFTTSAFGDKVRSQTTIRLEAAGPGKIRRVGEVQVEAKIFGMAGFVEGSIETSMRETWAAGAAFTADWLARHPAE